VYREVFDRLIAYEDGRTVNRGRVLFDSALKQISARLPAGWSMEDLAATIQVVAEDVAREYVRHWARATGLRDVALAGGLFANVRINEEIHSLPEVESVFVHPGMSDEGLGVGAALATSHAIARERGLPHEPARLPDVYLGTGYTEREIAGALERAGLEIIHHPGRIEDEVAGLLAQG
jgi:carbamoyltransferase